MITHILFISLSLLICTQHQMNKDFGFQVDVGTGTSYAQTITSTSFLAEHTEGGSSGSVAYNTSRDQAQGTANQIIASGVGNDNDQACSGELTIYSPSSTTFVKHFMSTSNVAHNNQFTQKLVYSRIYKYHNSFN